MENTQSEILQNNHNIDSEPTQIQQDTKKDDKKFNKLNLPKRKYAIIHGYNGHNYSGNQK